MLTSAQRLTAWPLTNAVLAFGTHALAWSNVVLYQPLLNSCFIACLDALHVAVYRASNTSELNQVERRTCRLSAHGTRWPLTNLA
jgi:hypothetical protein